jgi:hypothetical protein
MHERNGIVTAAAITALVCASGASAQKDAAEKAQEGSIDHWIEYYKAEQRKSVAPSPQAPAAPADQPAPAERTESVTSPQGKTTQ